MAHDDKAAGRFFVVPDERDSGVAKPSEGERIILLVPLGYVRDRRPLESDFQKADRLDDHRRVAELKREIELRPIKL
jgi:hypothetical protein